MEQDLLLCARAPERRVRTPQETIIMARIDGSRHGPLHVAALLGTALLVALLTSACGSSGPARSPRPSEPPTFSARFLVSDTTGAPVVGATVYLVPAGDIDGSPINGDDIRTGASENRDEPLEDAIRLHGTGYLRAITGPDGSVAIPSLTQGRYFPFVSPAATDTEHLPGGSACRVALESSVIALRDIVRNG